MLVVRRIEIGKVELADGCGDLERVAAQRAAVAGEQLRYPELERMMRTLRPLLHVGHLDTGRGVDAIGGLDQAREQDREQG